MYACICVYLCALHTCACMCVCTCVCMCVHPCVCTRVCTCACVHLRVQLCASVCACVYLCVSMYASVCACVHVCASLCACVLYISKGGQRMPHRRPHAELVMEERASGLIPLHPHSVFCLGILTQTEALQPHCINLLAPGSSSSSHAPPTPLQNSIATQPRPIFHAPKLSRAVLQSAPITVINGPGGGGARVPAGRGMGGSP